MEWKKNIKGICMGFYRQKWQKNPGCKIIYIRKDYVHSPKPCLVVVYGFGKNQCAAYTGNTGTYRRKSCVFVTKVYLMRWRIEDTSVFKTAVYFEV